ncbi:GyrI-like domain-containing protein [Nonomuraea sp. NPDC004186]
MPEIIELPERPYVGVRKTITMTQFNLVGDRIGEIIGWLVERGAYPAGAPFLRYDEINMAADRLVVEAGVPVATPVEGESDIFTPPSPPAATPPSPTTATRTSSPTSSTRSGNGPRNRG